jgi:uncharacterized GH25 family protein
MAQKPCRDSRAGRPAVRSLVRGARPPRRRGRSFLDPRRAAPLALGALLAAAAAGAHDTWLLPARFRTEAGERLSFGLTSGMAFPEPETAVAADRLTEAKLRLTGTTVVLEPGAADPRSLPLAAAPAGHGVAVAWIATAGRTLELTDHDVLHYLEEVGALESIGAEWTKAGRPAWRETYSKRAKAYVRVGARGDDGWRAPSGLDLEIVPDADPTALSAGDTLSVRVLWNGRPLPGQAVGASGSPPARPVLATTDADGRVSFLLSQPGPWLLRATRIRPSESHRGEWESVFTTLTFEARQP